MSDVRKAPPKGMNTEDMKADGSRWCMLQHVGPATSVDTVLRVMRSWDVKKWWVANKIAYASEPFPKPSNDGGPEFMLLFGDGKWRYASFGGINGPPCASCRWEGFEAPNGEAAYHMMVLERKIRHRVDAEAKVTALANEIADLKTKLAVSMQQPERTDETWKK